MHPINGIKDKNVIILISEEIAFEKNPIFFHDKNPQQIRNRIDFFNPDQ